MAKKNNFWTGAKNVATNYGLALGDTALSTVGLTDVVKDKHYKGSTADTFAKVGNISGGITKMAAPIALGIVAGPMGAQAAMGVQNTLGGTVNQGELAKIQQAEQSKIARENQPTAFMQEPPKTNSLGSYVTYEKGGQPKDVVVNIEKDELEVDPKTGEIVKDFKSKPEHPKGKDIINLKGNVAVNTSNVIIPAKYRDKYLSGDKMIRREIISTVLKDQSERENMPLKKMATGGFVPNISESDYNFTEIIPNTGGISDQTSSSAVTSGDKTDYANFVNQSGGSGFKYPSTTGATPEAAAGGMSNVDSGTIAGAASAIPGMVYGINQTVQSKKALEKLQKTPMARYSLGEQQAQVAKAQELENAAKGRARMGFTPEERAQYEQSVARQGQTMASNAAKIGGAQGSMVMGQMARAAGTNALLDFAAKNAQMQRQNQQQADQASRYTNQTLGQLAAQKNLQTGTDINYRLRQEQALGQALSQGRQNVTNSAGQLAGYGAMAGSQAMGAQAPAAATPSYEEYLKQFTAK